MVSAGAWDMQRKAERGSLGQPRKEKARGRCYCCLQLLSRRCRADGDRLFSDMLRDRIRDKEHQLEHEKIQPGTWKQAFAISVVKHCTGPKVRVASPAILKDTQDQTGQSSEHPAPTGQLLAGGRPRDFQKSLLTTHGVHSTDFCHTKY